MKLFGSLAFAAVAAIALAATPALAAKKAAMTCMDYAYQSQDAQDCAAGKIKPPAKHMAMKHAPTKAMAPKKATKS